MSCAWIQLYHLISLKHCNIVDMILSYRRWNRAKPKFQSIWRSNGDRDHLWVDFLLIYDVLIGYLCNWWLPQKFYKPNLHWSYGKRKLSCVSYKKAENCSPDAGTIIGNHSIRKILSSLHEMKWNEGKAERNQIQRSLPIYLHISSLCRPLRPLYYINDLFNNNFWSFIVACLVSASPRSLAHFSSQSSPRLHRLQLLIDMSIR